MTMLDTGTYGAKVQSWRTANPRELLKRLVEENPRADKSALFVILWDFVRTDEGEDYLKSIVEYWHSNNYHSLIEQPSPQRAATRATQRARQVEQIKETVKTRIRQEAQLILLDMVMPNGKALRDCTGKDCAKAGGWLTKIAGKLKPSEKVGDVLDEGAVRKLYGR